MTIENRLSLLAGDRQTRDMDVLCRNGAVKPWTIRLIRKDYSVLVAQGLTLAEAVDNLMAKRELMTKEKLNRDN